MTGTESGDMHTQNDEESGEHERAFSRGRGRRGVYNGRNRGSAAQELTVVSKDGDRVCAGGVRRGCRRDIDQWRSTFRAQRNEIRTSRGNSRGRGIVVEKSDISRTNIVRAGTRGPCVCGDIENRGRSKISSRESQ